MIWACSRPPPPPPADSTSTTSRLEENVADTVELSPEQLDRLTALTPPPRRTRPSARPVPGGPGPVIHPPGQLSLDARELAEPVGVADLPGVLQPGHLPHPVGLHTRRVLDPGLDSQVVHDLGRDVRRIGQERAHEQQRRELHREPQPGMRQPPGLDQSEGLVVEQEEPVQVRF